MPYRYDKGAGQLVVDPQQIRQFNTVIRLAENHTIRQIADKTKLPFSRIRRIVADDRLLFYQARRIDPQTGREIKGQWPAVITELQAAAIKRNRRAGYHNPRREITGLLANLNLLTCAYCCRSVRTWANGRKKTDGTRTEYYGCRHMDNRQSCNNSRMVQQHILDQLVTAHVIKTLSDKNLKNYWMEQSEKNDSSTQIEQLQKEIGELKKKKSCLINAITEGIIEFSDAKQKRIEIDAASNACEKRIVELERVETTPPDWNAITITADDWHTLSIIDQRQILSSILAEITISKTRLVLTYKFPRNKNGHKTAEIRLPAPQKPGPKSKRKLLTI